MGGCSLNFVDINDVLSHDFLQGVITAIDAADDTCTVEVDGRTLAKVPLFFNGGINTSPRILSPSGRAGGFSGSVIGAALDFEGPVPAQVGPPAVPTVPGDSVIVMIGRGIYYNENFVLGLVTGKKLRYYLADFKRMYALHPAGYWGTSYLEHYAVDQVVIRPFWYEDESSLWVFDACVIPLQPTGTDKKDWYFAIWDCVTGTGAVYNTISIQVPNVGHYSGYAPLEGMPYRPSPLGQIYTFKTNISVSDYNSWGIHSGITPPRFRADLGYWDLTTDRFVSKKIIYPQTVLGLGENPISFDFTMEDLSGIPNETGHIISLRAQVITIGPVSMFSSWMIYSILPKEQ